MTSSNINAMAKDVADRYNLECPVEIRFIDLASEVGELGKEILKTSNYGKEACKPSASKADEIGDVLFSLACIANTLGVDLEDAMRAAIEKYHARFAKTGDVGSGHSQKGSVPD